MTANSEFGAYIEVHNGHVDNDEGVHADVARTLINNALHFGDESSQCRVKWRDPDNEFSRSPAVDDALVRLWFCDIPVTVDASGSAFSLRVRAAGRSAPGAQGSGGDQVKLRVVVAESPGAAASDVTTTANANVVEFTSSSTTEAWLGTDLITLGEGRTRAARRVVGSLGADGTEYGGLEARFFCSVWGSSADADMSNPALTGLQVDEYAA